MLLVSHAQTGLTVAFIGVAIALITLLTSIKDIGSILKKVDYKTLLFFIGLFIVVGGLEQTGVLEMIASFIEKVCGAKNGLLFAYIYNGRGRRLHTGGSTSCTGTVFHGRQKSYF